jgi:threonine dehydrogenase-like Zn-dependent dehydrogenase
VVGELGSEVSGLRRGDLVVSPFAYSDNTCEFCHEGLHTSCRNGGFWATGGVGGAQAEAIRLPQASGTLVRLPVGEDSELLPSLLTLADVYGTGYHAAKQAEVNPRTTRWPSAWSGPAVSSAASASRGTSGRRWGSAARSVPTSR